MTDAAPEPEVSEEEIKRKFREALERKHAENAGANAARGGKDAGKIHGARGLARSRRSFRRKTGGWTANWAHHATTRSAGWEWVDRRFAARARPYSAAS